MSINRNNYEEYFILYMDNELGAEDRLSVEEFVRANPDLKDELDMLLQTKLTPDNAIVYEGAEELLFGNAAATIDPSNYEEWLILYTDNELDSAQQKAVEQYLAANPLAQEEFNLLKQTRLQPEHINFPNKESLYRYEERVRKITWWRVAAAVFILAMGSVVFVLMNKKGVTTDKGIASADTFQKEPVQTIQDIVDNDKKEVITNVEQKDPQTLPEKKTLASSTTTSNKRIAPGLNKQAKIPELRIAAVEPEKQTPVNLTNPINNNIERNSIRPEVNINTGIAANNTDNTETRASQQNSNKNAVTQTPYDTYNNSDEQANPDNDDVIYASQGNSRKSKLRGFLRKVTRTFEKNTKIDATDDDDRLLVGGLAIKL